jgi:hypothetical protein
MTITFDPEPEIAERLEKLCQAANLEVNDAINILLDSPLEQIIGSAIPAYSSAASIRLCTTPKKKRLRQSPATSVSFPSLTTVATITMQNQRGHVTAIGRFCLRAPILGMKEKPSTNDTRSQDSSCFNPTKSEFNEFAS